MTMRQRHRRNPKGLRRSVGEASAMAIAGLTRTTGQGFVMTEPDGESVGFDVKDWAAVFTTCSAEKSPDDDGNPCYARVRPWRYYSDSPVRQADNDIKGRWVQDYDRYFALNPEAMADASQTHRFETLDSDRMFFQIVETIGVDDAGSFPIEWIHLQCYGYIRKDEPMPFDPLTGAEATPAGAGGGGAALALADGEWLYSVERGDYLTTYVNATSFTVTNAAGAAVDIDTDKIVAIGRRAPDGTLDSMDIAVRGVNLGVSTTAPNTVTIGPPTPFTFLATDLISIWVEKEGRSIARDSEAAPDEAQAIGGLARETQAAAVTEGDIAQVAVSLYREIILASHTYATDSDRTEEIAPAEEKPVVEELYNDEDIQSGDTIYLPSSDGWPMFPHKDYALQIYLIGGKNATGDDITVTLTVEGSDDLTLAAGREWVENTNALYSENRDATSQTFTATGDTAFEDLADMDEFNHKRARIKVEFSEAGEDADPTADDPATVAVVLRRKVR